ncbi:MAG: hypothetical protein A2293_00655 [Elusimicrobia bacterium RIFOXYB2_FULL_49_7]|nr:MAG: hypothetical protein A2293_00655 [Elusimicrobia bacterium RIFOXYB2_FULL_49_7]
MPSSDPIRPADATPFSETEYRFLKEKVEFMSQVIPQLMERFQKAEGAYDRLQEDVRKLSQELDGKNKLLSRILESLTNAVVAVDVAGRITSFNRGAERITGISAEEAIGKPYPDVLGGGVDEAATLTHTLKTGQHISAGEKKLHHASGHPVTVGFTTALLDDQEGRPLGALEVMQDMTEVRYMQEELVRSRTLAALGEMAAAVAHEIRNPIGAMGGFAAMLESDLENDAPKLDLVRKLMRTLSRLNKIVGNLLVYTKPLSLQSCDVHLQQHLEQILDFVTIGMDGTRIRMERQFPEKPILLRSDPEKIEQIVINIVQNAVRAIPEEGTITVTLSVRETSLNERLFLNGVKVNRVVSVEIADTGKGIREEDLTKIFNPFFTTREDGNGLGLSIVKKMVDLHNGEISVKSRVGEGSVFTLAFPG